jgi:response regulator RpfG family c-di-GMP phosphodiesterase
MIMADLVIIDDDPDNLESLSEIMLAAGHNVRIGHNGQVGLHLVEERLPDLSLLDVEMPLLDGPGMAHSMFVRDLGLELIPVILISGVVDLKGCRRRSARRTSSASRIVTPSSWHWSIARCTSAYRRTRPGR